MKKLFALVALICCMFSVCCAPRVVPAPPPRALDVTTLSVRREMDLLLHVDADFNADDRAAIAEAARRWREVSKGRANLRVAFDLDFQSTSSLRAHVADTQVRLVTSELDVVHRLEARLGRGPGVTILAVKEQREAAGDVVFLIRDRIVGQPKLLAVVTHELGHVLGLPDLQEMGSIMSGSSNPWRPEPVEFTPEDIALCREYRYCD